jgi:hypothetical protein
MSEIAVKSVKTNVQKVVIQAFKDKKFTDYAGMPSFTVPINPEQFNQKFEVKSDQTQGSGNQGTAGKYGVTLPEELKLDFFLDHTNTVAGNVYQNMKVPEQVHKLLETVYNMHGPTHQPNFLKIGWNSNPIFGSNKTTFECKLKSLDINYVLFNAEGEPLRAKVSAVFVAFVEDQKRVQQQDTQSPDLTHVRTATPADSLWMMTHKIYGDPKYVLQIARENKLDTFRRINAGDEYHFPPFDKAEIKK